MAGRRTTQAYRTIKARIFIEFDEEFRVRTAGSRLYVLPKFLQQLRGFVRVMRIGSVRTRGYMFRVIRQRERMLDAAEHRTIPQALRALRHHPHTSNYRSSKERTEVVDHLGAVEGEAMRPRSPMAHEGPTDEVKSLDWQARETAHRRKRLGLPSWGS